MPYVFWFNVNSEQHAKDICALNGLTLGRVRHAPELSRAPRVSPGKGARPKVTKHIRGNILHCRATKECTAEEALELNKIFGFHQMPEEIKGNYILESSSGLIELE